MKNKLKILFFADAGVEHTIRWVKYFVDVGHEVHVISWNDFSGGSASYRVDDIKNSFYPAKLHILGGKRPKNKFTYLLWLTRLVLNIRKLYKNIKPDLIHSHSVGSYAWITLLLPKTNTIMTPWGTDVLIDMKQSSINRYLSTKAMNKSLAITVDAEHMKQELINFGIDSKKISVIYFGTDTNFYKKSEEDRLRIRDKYNLKYDDLVVISTRTLNPIHDVFLTIRCIPDVLLTSMNKIKFIIASDGIEREEMEEYVSKNGLSSNVIFPGYMTMQEMVAFLSAADIYVSSSKADAGLAASTAEAMSIGLPIIVSNNSENSFWVENSGLLFDDGDSKGIANAILQIANDKELSSNFGTNGRARILRDNDYKTEMSKVNSLYLNICSKVE